MDVDVDFGDILVRHPVPRRRLSVADYHRMLEVGILREGDRVELLEGQLAELTSIGSRHAIVVGNLTEILVMALAGMAVVRVQCPVTLGDLSEPEPDFAVVRPRWHGYPAAHPGPGDIFLLIEVADTSMNTDSGAKLAIYAKAGIKVSGLSI